MLQALTLVLSLTSAAGPQSVDAQLASAKAAYEELEYEQAANEMMLVATRDDATEAQKVEANLYAGMANVVMGREVRARLNFRYVVARAPDVALPEGTSPKVSSFFALVREEMLAPQVASTTGPGEAPSEPEQPNAAAAPPSAPAGGAVDGAAAGSLPLPAVEEERGFPWLLSIGIGTGVVGAMLLSPAVLLAVVGEWSYLDTSADTGLRDNAQAVAPFFWGAVLVGLAVVGAGVGMAVWGMVE